MNKVVLTVMIAALMYSCTPDDDSNQAEPVLNIENARLFDDNGSPIGCHPECDDDWNNFSIGYVEALDFADTITRLSDSSVPINYIFPYPNPFRDVQYLALSSPYIYKVKIAIVDSTNKIILQRAVRVDESSPIMFDHVMAGLEDEVLYRMYYRVTNADDVVVYEGYGDIYGCDDPAGSIECYPD